MTHDLGLVLAGLVLGLCLALALCWWALDRAVRRRPSVPTGQLPTDTWVPYGAPNTIVRVAPWGKRWVGRVRYVPTALGLPYANRGESWDYFRTQERAEQWVRVEAEKGLHP